MSEGSMTANLWLIVVLIAGAAATYVWRVLGVALSGRIDPSETTQIYFNSESFSNPGREIAPEVEAAWNEALVPGDGRDAAQEELLRQIDTAMPNIPILYPKVGLAYSDNVHGLTWYRSGHIEFAGVTVTS